MDAESLRALQAPLKTRYRQHPHDARVTLKAKGTLHSQAIACNVETNQAFVEAGLHPATGGDGSFACSGDMLLQALVACAGVTLRAVATSLAIKLSEGSIVAEGDLDFRGTLGVGKEVPVGFSAIRLKFHLHSDATADELAKLIQLTERYCVVYQTLQQSPHMTLSIGVQ